MFGGQTLKFFALVLDYRFSIGCLLQYFYRQFDVSACGESARVRSMVIFRVLPQRPLPQSSSGMNRWIHQLKYLCLGLLHLPWHPDHA
jgi:hypothetical protein